MRRIFILLFVSILGVVRGGELKVVTINVWSGLNYTGNIKMGEYESVERREKRYRILIHQLEKLAPDVVALNEANKQPGFTKWVAKELGFGEIHTVGNGGIKIFNFGLPVNLKEGDAILARKTLKLKLVGKRKLSGDRFGIHTDFFTFHFRETNFVIVGRINFEGENIYVANTHLYASILMSDSLWNFMKTITPGEQEFIRRIVRQGVERRLLEVRALLEYVEDSVPMGAPVVLMGDFNDVEGSVVYNEIIAAGFVDAYRLKSSSSGYTWDPENNTNIDPIQLDFLRGQGDLYSRAKLINDSRERRIDYIFLKNIAPERVKSVGVVFNTPCDNIFPSDHYGVMVTIKF